MSDEDGRRNSGEDMFRSLGEPHRPPSDDETGWQLAGAILVLIVTLAMIAAANFYAP